MMKTDHPIERIISKLDNDFNIDNSDWIPRVGAWVYDALANLRVSITERKRIKLKVVDRIVYSPHTMNKNTLIVYNSRGCKISEITKECDCSSDCDSSYETKSYYSSQTTDVVINNNPNYSPEVRDQQINDNSLPARYNVYEISTGSKPVEESYVYLDNRKLELTYDETCVTIEFDSPATYISETYGCELPYIPDNGLVIECITAWCMYKILCRGTLHPVLNLTSNSPATNPYIMWMQNKENARASFIIDSQKQSSLDSDVWKSSFYLYTFN